MSPFAGKGKEDHEDGPPLLDQDDAVPFSNIASSLESIACVSNMI